MKYRTLLCLGLLCFFLPALAQVTDFIDYGKSVYIVKDPKGNSYTALKMKDGRTWLGTNLKYAIRGSYCYNNNKKYCQTYGRLYTVQAAEKACRQLGPRWRLPSVDEWKKLARSYGGYNNGHGRGDGRRAYKTLTKVDKYGFWARLGGQRNGGPHYKFSGINQTGYYWTASPEVPSASNGHYWSFWFLQGEMYHDDVYGNDERSTMSVRCIKF